MVSCGGSGPSLSAVLPAAAELAARADGCLQTAFNFAPRRAGTSGAFFGTRCGGQTCCTAGLAVSLLHFLVSLFLVGDTNSRLQIWATSDLEIIGNVFFLWPL